MSAALTQRQSQVLAMIKSFIRSHGCAPTTYEIQRHFGFASQNSAMQYLLALREKGQVDWTPRRGRSICVGRSASLKAHPIGKFTYFFHDEVTGKVKIGASSDIQRRKVQLETGYPCKLTLLAVLPAEFKEADVRHRFSADRIRGEWFHYSDAIKAFIASQEEGSRS